MGKATKNPKQPSSAVLQRWQSYCWWEKAIVAIGLISLIGVFVILFLPFGKGPAEYKAESSIPAVGSPAFLQTLSNQMAIPVGDVSRPEMLVDGDAFIARFLADIDAAHSSICMMNYIWSDGRFSNQVLSHLESKAAAGVKVYILLDAYGSIKAPSFDKLKAAGGKVVTFRSLVPLPWTIMRATKRNHRRAITIDGLIGYTGGVAVDDKWLGTASSPEEWHDLMFRFTGSVAARLMGSFSELWMATTGEMLLAANQPAVPDEGIPYVTLSTSPSPDLFESETFFLISLWAARTAIHVETPYFLPDAAIREALMQKARAGADVVLLLPSSRTDEKSVRWAGQRIFEELLQAGVKIYEYQPTFTHAKLLVEDGQWSVVGSANWDNRSRKLNDEIVVGMSDSALASQLEDRFKIDLRRAKPITLQDWQKRGLIQRALEYVSQTFVQQY